MNEKVQEDYIDLECENLPEFNLDSIKEYRKAVLELFTELYKTFPFDVVALSCYSSFNYINTIEIAYILKKKVNPNAILVVGGVHPTIKPEDFQPGNFPEYFYADFPKSKKETPFDYLIREEGELPFFELISKLINQQIELRNNQEEDCIILEPQFLDHLEDLPLINLQLFKRYKEEYSKKKILWIDFSRGCPYKCCYCYNSEKYMISYNNVRIKSPEMCIQELTILKKIDWLNLEGIYLTDPLFFPRRKTKKRFLELMEANINEHGAFQFELLVMERIDTIDVDLFKQFKKLHIGFDIGLESGSKTLLKKMGKIPGKDDDQLNIRVDRYLRKAKQIIKAASKHNISIIFNLMTCMPGANKEKIEECFDFFLEKESDGKALAEKHIIQIQVNKYVAYYGTRMYHIAEQEFGSVIHFKEWWKIFDKDQVYFATYVDPSRDLSLKEAFELTINYLKQFYKMQVHLIGPSAFKAILEYHKEAKHSLKLLRMLQTKRLTQEKKLLLAR